MFFTFCQILPPATTQYQQDLNNNIQAGNLQAAGRNGTLWGRFVGCFQQMSVNDVSTTRDTFYHYLVL